VARSKRSSRALALPLDIRERSDSTRSMGVEARVAQLSTLIGWLAEGIEPTVEAHEGGSGTR
jgi:hypothetical protein